MHSAAASLRTTKSMSRVAPEWSVNVLTPTRIWVVLGLHSQKVLCPTWTSFGAGAVLVDLVDLASAAPTGASTAKARARARARAEAKARATSTAGVARRVPALRSIPSACPMAGAGLTSGLGTQPGETGNRVKFHDRVKPPPEPRRVDAGRGEGSGPRGRMSSAMAGCRMRLWMRL